MSKKDILNQESQKLIDTIELIKLLLEIEKEKLEDLYGASEYSINEIMLLERQKKQLIKNLEYAVNNPYFARIDFTYNDENILRKIYIGKKGVNDNNEIVVTDWRSPIASLYYDSDIGKCSFLAPEGTIYGNLSLKRQFEIDHGELLNYFDVSLVSNDELLQKYLNTNNDARLKTIVATIQKEQNEVIRKDRMNNLIIQGVAGSGKTTVALHRIAYLVYNNKETIKQNQYLVIGPNPVFMKYIESVLPDLDVTGVEQFTYEQFAKNYIGEDIKINSSDKKLMLNIAGKINTSIDKFKCSMTYKELIDKFMKTYFLNITSKPLMLNDFVILSNEQVTNIFQQTIEEYNNDLRTIMDVACLRICNYIEYNFDSILKNYGNYTKSVFSKATTESEKDKLRKKFTAERAELDVFCRNIVKKYLNKGIISTTKLYKLFVNCIDDLCEYNISELRTLKQETLNNIKNGSYDFEDLAAMVYIKSIISRNAECENLKHIVIDEAQDLGEFNFYSLKKVLPNATFSIFGDIAQSIYDYRSISSWDDVNRVMFDNQGEIINFNKSYRTTAEIMDVADNIAERLGFGRSELVVRHGKKVNFTSIDNDMDIPKYIIEKIKDYQQKGYKKIALISKTNLLSNYLSDDLYDLNMKVSNVTSNDDLTSDEFDVCCISNQLVKGLEFDAVIINNANEKIYSSDNKLDMKLLYVAVTRALHDLDIVYSGQLTKALLNEENIYTEDAKKLVYKK